MATPNIQNNVHFTHLVEPSQEDAEYGYGPVSLTLVGNGSMGLVDMQTKSVILLTDLQVEHILADRQRFMAQIENLMGDTNDLAA